jgi:hypothetical protein
MRRIDLKRELRWTLASFFLRWAYSLTEKEQSFEGTHAFQELAAEFEKDLIEFRNAPAHRDPSERDARGNSILRWLLVGVAIGIAIGMCAAQARDLGQWGNSDPAVREWFQSLMQPDVPTASCCGPADAYWCDEIHVRDGRTFCTITDDRDDAILGRSHIDVGTEIEIPPNKIKWDRGNPTGHFIVFVSPGRFVFCFVLGNGA